MYGTDDVLSDEGTGKVARSVGTRFLIYPQVPHLANYATPETVWISTPPDRIRPGPSDRRAYVRDPLFDKGPYEYPYLPPYIGDTYPPAMPGFDGHYDSINPNSRQFLAAHAFACVCRVLDIWESYLGRPVVWHFAETYEQLEIVPYISWDNAQSGYGYLELGLDHDAATGKAYPYALNFDVIAHEVGHSILFSQMGLPASGHPMADYVPYHEAMADVISLLSFLHFDSGLDRLLRHSDGNLLVLNELNRIAELSGDRQIRLASNSRRKSEVSGDVHDQSRPLTGAIFDTLIETYHVQLVERGLADERLLSVDIKGMDGETLRRISEFTAKAHRARPFMFKSALVAARDEVALALAPSWSKLQPDNLTFAQASDALVWAAEPISLELARRLEANLLWRELI
jgi:hypothetical protein